MLLHDPRLLWVKTSLPTLHACGLWTVIPCCEMHQLKVTWELLHESFIHHYGSTICSEKYAINNYNKYTRQYKIITQILLITHSLLIGYYDLKHFDEALMVTTIENNNHFTFPLDTQYFIFTFPTNPSHDKPTPSIGLPSRTLDCSMVFSLF